MDMGQNVAPVLEEHRDKVLELGKLVEGEIVAAGDVGTKTDDLFLLRFLLSAKMDVGNAAEDVRKCLEWRKENIEQLRHVKENGTLPGGELFMKYQVVGYAGELGELKHPVFIVRVGLCNTKGLLKAVEHKQIVNMMLYNSEISFQICDQRTRESGKMVKMVNVIDMYNMSLFQADRRFAKCVGESSHVSQFVYPQLLGKAVMINVPTALRYMIKFVNKLQSKKTVEKQVICPAQKTHKLDASTCPFISDFKAAPTLPDFLGGTNTTYANTLLPMEERESTKHIQLDSRSSRKFSLILAKGETLPPLCEIEIEKGSIFVSAKFQDQVLIDQKLITSSESLVTLQLKCDFATGGTLVVECFNETKSKVPFKITLDTCEFAPREE
uniref:CRAL-TRIO domain-containing protein n=1 Tax=Mucochytrium quahogii TaxID=96639 RepID=A0A7S2SLF9_9STRA|mmetsp:Transcript_17506/g.28334  ORF Transcript_17506/g.28334 Transcript_17506/m.28334 type:complete len:383 (-) Transcript_17506:78-1226(-)